MWESGVFFGWITAEFTTQWSQLLQTQDTASCSTRHIARSWTRSKTCLGFGRKEPTGISGHSMGFRAFLRKSPDLLKRCNKVRSLQRSNTAGMKFGPRSSHVKIYKMFCFVLRKDYGNRNKNVGRIILNNSPWNCFKPFRIQMKRDEMSGERRISSEEGKKPKLNPKEKIE